MKLFMMTVDTDLSNWLSDREWKKKMIEKDFKCCCGGTMRYIKGEYKWNGCKLKSAVYYWCDNCNEIALPLKTCQLMEEEEERCGNQKRTQG